ncbi:kynurenine 3-monooxygenase [Xylaria venustula]|nr:kynurenine 3-monooxygenase [Xylaria venustula]
MVTRQKVIVIGGGPVGALSALYAARRGFEVELYELRDDPNHGDPTLRPDFAVIPLALSERGIRAIQEARVPSLLEDILRDSRPTAVRMIHTTDKRGNLKEIPMQYGPQGQCLYTIQRETVTKHCLLALEKEPTAKLTFNHKLTNIDFDNKAITVEAVVWKDTSYSLGRGGMSGNEPPGHARPIERLGTMVLDAPGRKPVDTLRFKTVKYDFFIGADGTYSTVRQHLMRVTEIDFSQVYANSLWCDLIFAGDEHHNYRMDPTCLHLWPADDNIVVAQPDLNGTFRAGMVCRTEQVRYYEAHPEEFVGFLNQQFPGIVPKLISAEQATAQFLAHQKIPLRSIKLNKFGYRDEVLLLGDSAHSMTPFHAMGMIIGLEDVRIFFEDFRDPAGAATGTSEFCLQGIIAAYTAHRVSDVNEMVDMANEHYHELRHGVRSRLARARQACDILLSRWVPFLGWAPLYTRIQFSHERISVIRKIEARQQSIISLLFFASTTALLWIIVVGCRNLMR